MRSLQKLCSSFQHLKVKSKEIRGLTCDQTVSHVSNTDSDLRWSKPYSYSAHLRQAISSTLNHFVVNIYAQLK